MTNNNTIPSTAHVICCNDAVIHVYLGDESGAKAKIEELARAEYERQKWSYNLDYDRYRDVCYWHIHTVAVSAVE